MEIKMMLPTYGSPPVVEVVMGVQFPPLNDLTAPYLGRFWDRVHDQYPTCSEHPRLAAKIEDFDQPPVSQPTIQLIDSPELPRVFFESNDGQWLIQVQRERFLHNWRMAPGATYPRFPAVRNAFLRNLSLFKEFLRENQLGEPDPQQYELTYLNKIGIIPGHTTGEIFPAFGWRSQSTQFAMPESHVTLCTFRDGTKPRRLRTSVRPIEQGRQLLFELTVRGRTADDETGEAWFEASREWIVTAFDELTGPEYHRVWEKQT